jgi:hypothetical protein
MLSKPRAVVQLEGSDQLKKSSYFIGQKNNDGVNFISVSATMALPSRPECLLSLSVGALVNYVSQLLLQLVTFPQYTAADNLKQPYVDQTCRCLQVYWKLPSSLVNEVTAKLLHCINKTYGDIYYSAYRHWGDEVLPTVLSAVLHPALTRLECIEDLSHTVECQEFMWDRLFLTIHGVVYKFPNLKVLKYGYIRRTKDWVISDINVSANLEHLWFLELCNDQFLENVAAKCSRLKSIDVSNSSNVTDESIQYLLKFEHLEGLNVSCTGISERGLARLLVGLSQTKVCDSGCTNMLKSFGSNNMTSFEMEILACDFQNLTSVNLCPKDELSFSPLKKLKHLSRLTLSWTEFYQTEDLLFTVGPQLVFLELHHVYNVKMSVIGEMCPSVRCLHISSGSFLETEEEIDFLMESRCRSCSSVFSSVVCLHLDFPRACTEYLVSECKRLKKLYVRIGSRSARQLLEFLFQRNQLTQLEKYHWGTCTKTGGDVIVSRPTEESIFVSVVDPFQRNKVLLRTEEVLLLQDQPHNSNTDTANTGNKDMH